MTSNIRTRRMAAVVAGASIFALTLSACSSSEGETSTPKESKDASGNVTLTIATFNQFGYTPELLKEYEAANPGIKVEQTVAAQSGEARTNLTTRLAAGGDGLADIEAIEVDWMPELSEIADSFEDLAGPDGNVTLTIATFNQFGYTPELLKEYEDANPGIKVEQTVAAQSGDARTNLTTRLAAGGDGLADIEAIEVDWMPELSEISDSFEDVSGPEVEGRYLAWKEAQGTATDGKLIGLGTDIGPEAICYRSDLFAAAGLPTDRAEVAALLGGADATWEDYFKVGHQFVENSESAWYDSAVAIMQAQIGQLDAAYEDPETGEPTDLAENTDVKAMYDTILAESADLSAGLKMWEKDWEAGFQNNAFATMPCPPWMTASIAGEAAGVDGWDVADVFPGGGGNWGGSFLTVPSTGKNTAEAIKLATWLTAPEQQAKAFAEAGTFPSQIEAQELPQVKDATNEFFNDAPVGQIFAARANQISDVPPFKGVQYFNIQTIVMDALNRVDIDGGDAAASWDEALTNFGSLGF